MTILRWTRRALDTLLVAALVTVAVTAGITLLAPVLGGRAMVIGGGSMEPTISRGALVLVVPAGARGYAVGDVVTVQQGAATPYTHRIVRLTALDGVPYFETKGDANPAPDPVIIPEAAIIGGIGVSVPVLGYLSALLGTPLGLAGFLALCATVLLLIWILEDLEDERRPAVTSARAFVCDDSESGIPSGAGAHAGAGILTPAAAGATPGNPAGTISVVPGVAATIARMRVREHGLARDPRTPVILEADRRTPRRRRAAKGPVAPESVVAAADATGAADGSDPAAVAGGAEVQGAASRDGDVAA